MTTYRGKRALFNYASAVRGFPQKVDAPLAKGLRQGVGLAHRRATRVFASRGIGRRIWGKDVTPKGGIRRRSNLGKFFSRRKVRRTGEGHFTSGFSLTGIPRLTQVGSRIRAHDIPKNGRPGDKLLVFLWDKVRGGEKAAATVRHPGGPIRHGRNFARRELERSGDDVKRLTHAAIADAAAKAGL